MEENLIGTAEIAKLTGLSQRLVRYMANDGKVPYPETRPSKRGFRFDLRPLMASGWIQRHTVDKCEPKRRGRKPKTAYLKLESMPADKRVVFIRDARKFTRELAKLSKALAAKLTTLVPHLTLEYSERLFKALEPLERARYQVGRKYRDAEIGKRFAAKDASRLT